MIADPLRRSKRIGRLLQGHCGVSVSFGFVVGGGVTMIVEVESPWIKGA